MKCVIYTRTAIETEVDNQRQLGETFIASKDWTCLPNRYDDQGYSGANMDRPALQRLLADVETGEIGCLVVCNVSRLARSASDVQMIKAVLANHGVTLVEADQ